MPDDLTYFLPKALIRTSPPVVLEERRTICGSDDEDEKDGDGKRLLLDI